MKLLKIASLSLICFMLNNAVINAQSGNHNWTEEQKMELAKTMAEYFESLNLGEEQKGDFESISKKYGSQLMALKDSDSSKFRKYRKVKSIQKSKNKEMKKLLSKEQYELYLDKQKEFQKKMRDRKASTS